MKFSLSWLKEHLETNASAADIADKLTNIGLEVEEVTNPGEALAPFRIAKVLTAEKHPQADKLQVLTVDAGTGETIQVVCGAPNARAGMVGVFGAPGTYVPGSDLTLKVAAIRGVESRGMMCSARELELGEDHSGIIELPDDAPVGAAFTGYAGLDDPVFDVNMTPNRQDAMGVRGIARDLAAAGLGTLKPLAVPQIEGSFPCPVPIRIDDPEGCPAFYAQSVVLAEFLSKERGPQVFATFVKDGLRHGYDTALQRHYNMTFTQLEQIWQDRVIHPAERVAAQ